MFGLVFHLPPSQFPLKVEVSGCKQIIRDDGKLMVTGLWVGFRLVSTMKFFPCHGGADV